MATRRAPTTTGPMIGCRSSMFRRYDIIRAFEMMANGEMNGYICQGFNPLQAFPDKGKIRSGPGQAEIPRHDGPARHGDLAVLGEFRPAKSVRPGQHPDGSLPIADDLLCRRERHAGQFGALAAMALESGRCARRSANRHLDHVRHFPSDARDVPQGRRRIPRSDPEPDLELHEPDRSEPGGTGART